MASILLYIASIRHRRSFGKIALYISAIGMLSPFGVVRALECERLNTTCQYYEQPARSKCRRPENPGPDDDAHQQGNGRRRVFRSSSAQQPTLTHISYVQPGRQKKTSPLQESSMVEKIVRLHNLPPFPTPANTNMQPRCTTMLTDYNLLRSIKF